MAYTPKSKRNPALDQGVWASYQGTRFLIAHTSNSHFQRMMARLQAPFRRDIEKGRMDPDQMKDIVSEALAHCILKDWDIADTPYNPKIGKQALLNDEGLREFVQDYSTDLANYRDEDIEQKGNI